MYYCLEIGRQVITVRIIFKFGKKYLRFSIKSIRIAISAAIGMIFRIKKARMINKSCKRSPKPEQNNISFVFLWKFQLIFKQKFVINRVKFWIKSFRTHSKCNFEKNTVKCPTFLKCGKIFFFFGNFHEI